MKKNLILLSVMTSFLLIGCGKDEHPEIAKKIENPTIHKEPTVEEKETIIFNGKFSNCESFEATVNGLKVCLISKINILKFDNFMEKRRLKVIDPRFNDLISNSEIVDPYIDFYYTDKQGKKRSLYIQQALPISVIESHEKGLPINVKKIFELFDFLKQENAVVEKINFTFLFYKKENVVSYVEIELDTEDIQVLEDKYKEAKN